MMYKTSGFTLIELLTVIAIIAILASVVLPRINMARDRGVETKIIAELASFHKIGMSEEISSSNFDVVCGMNGTATSTKLLQLVNSLRITSDQFVCNSNADAFAASAQLNAAEYWCVDSTGTKITIASTLGLGVTTCL